MAVTMVVQNDTGDEAGANSYQTVAEFRIYCENHGYDLTGKTDDQIMVALIKGRDYLDTRYRYKGTKLAGLDQETEWPRDNVVNRDGISFTGTPLAVAQAQAEYAFRALSDDLYEDAPTPTGGRSVSSESKSVGPISKSISYESSTVSGTVRLPEYPAADRILTAAGLTTNQLTTDR